MLLYSLKSFQLIQVKLSSTSLETAMWPRGLYGKCIKCTWTYKKILLYPWFFQFFGCGEESIYVEAFMGLLRTSFTYFIHIYKMNFLFYVAIT